MSEEVQGMTRHEPDPQPVRHTRVFSRDEVVIALREYLTTRGVTVPIGPTHLWGLERVRVGEPERVTLVVDAG